MTAIDTGLDDAVTDHIGRFLLRYFGSAARANVNRPNVDAVQDRDLLRLHWAISPVVLEVAIYALQHRHEIQSALTTAVRIEDAIARGRIDARATIIHRRITGLPTAIVGHEPLRSYDSAPNQVLVWVLVQAWSLAARFATMLPDGAAYRSSIDQTIQVLDQVRRLQAISQMAGQGWSTRRPTSAAAMEARRSRRELYRKAYAAYELLLRIESGEPEAITAMLRQTLLAPLEPWRRYELAVAFSLAEALASSTQADLILNLLMGNTRRPIVLVGPFEIFWQSRTRLAGKPDLEPSERVTSRILEAYGMSISSDRPDLVVLDADADVVASIVEVKYLTGEDASDRVRGAVAQIVRYSRLYHAIDVSGPLLGRSLVAVSQGTKGMRIPSPVPDDVPLIVDFAAIQLGQLSAWADRLRR